MPDTISIDNRSGILIFRDRFDLEQSFSNTVDVISAVGFNGDPNDFAADVRDYYLDHSAPGLLIIIGLLPERAIIREVLEAPAVINALPDRTFLHGPITGPLQISFDETGQPSADSHNFEQARIATGQYDLGELVSEIVTRGLLALFSSASTILPGSDHVHYKAPGGTHQSRFIIAGAAFPNRACASFAALGVWRAIEGFDFTEVVIDTSTIAAVAYAICDLARIFRPENPFPGVRVSAAYQDDTFVDQGAPWSERSSLFVVSVSVSGERHKRIAELTELFDVPGKVVSLFYAGQEPASDLSHLVDLIKRRVGPESNKIEPAKSFRPWKCQLCEQGSNLVEIVGESLIPASPRTVPRRITLADRPPWVREIGAKLFGKELFRANVADMASSGDARRFCYFDLNHAFDDPDTERAIGQWVDGLNLYAPDLLVHAGDAGSRAFLDWWTERHGASRLDVLSNIDLRYRQTLPSRKILVFCSAVASGRNLSEVARYLRAAAPESQITYLVVVARTQSESRWESISSDLTVISESQVHRVDALYKITMPSDRDVDINPWGYERGAWETLLNLHGTRDLSIEASVAEDVRARLSELSDNEGLLNNVFLPPAHVDRAVAGVDVRLRLTAGFAFWPSGWHMDLARVSQADVTVTIATLLNEARSRVVVNSKGMSFDRLAQDAHNRVVIDPFSFNRFTDGVVQAALLRSAGSKELDYSSSHELSRDMASVVASVFRKFDEPAGEATLEFLIAFLSRHLRVRPHDLAFVLDVLSTRLQDRHRSNGLTAHLVSACRYELLQLGA